MNPSTGWEHVKADVFWGEVADCKHIVQIYETDEVFIDALAGFALSGFDIEDCCIIIATTSHLKLLEDRLSKDGCNIEELIAAGKYMPHVAENLLSKTFSKGKYDQNLFFNEAAIVMNEARKTKRMIRMFGETAPLLYSMGYEKDALTMEHMGNAFCENEALCLFCAYSKETFGADKHPGLDLIYAEHSKTISGSAKQMSDIYYHDIVSQY